ncbi:hypothetical protein SAMN05421640_0360 [Ekhidna lutea]|uniref:Polymerase beta nucleotidyltransferase domain-containing protein n=1 Tax=Ekhidna lutea TaxID=447679 RepID=A0A239EY33_EKHLU|nr:nucleotidyltransferase domain-containing protein [Ekhidna lutea]SNS48943.1 hypothetical protein SAMN05421640_0360 [Ekhidna lutea]
MLNLEKDIENSIMRLCKKHYVESFALFGSAVRHQMMKDSDVDFLVRFNSKLKLLDYADNYFDLKRALENILNKEVDLVSERSLKNPILIKNIEESKVMLYEA